MKKIQYLYRINMHVYRTVFGTSRCIQRYLDGIRRIYHAPQQPGKMMILEGKDVFGKDQTIFVTKREGFGAKKEVLRQFMHMSTIIFLQKMISNV